MIAALLVVGSVSHGVLRHLVQTAPSWLTVYFGLRHRGIAKWTALPTYLFWLLLMVLIWGYLLGWTSIVHGHYSPTEIAMTIVVATACCVGIVQSLVIRSPSGFRPPTSDLRPPSFAFRVSTFVAVLALQLGAFILSLQPGIADR